MASNGIQISTYSIGEYSVGEEIANAITHGIGILAAVVGLTLMLSKAIPVLPGWKIAAVSVYGASLILMFLFSTLYHSITHLPSKAVLKRLDHCAIYLLIAGTYSPLMMIALGTPTAYTLLSVIWLLAFLGIAFKALFIHRYRRMALVTYLLMGWLCLFVVVELYKVLPGAGFSLIVIGGLFYTLGVVFYIAKQMPFSHAIWHLFVLGGTVSHCVAIAVYVIPSAQV